MRKPLPEITRLLSLGFSSIAALNLIALCVAFAAYSAFRAEQAAFTGETLPLANGAQRLAASANLLLLFSTEISAQTTAKSIDLLEEQVAKEVAAISAELEMQPALGLTLKEGYEVDAGSVASAVVESVEHQRENTVLRRQLEAAVNETRELIGALRLKLTAFSTSRAGNRSERDTWRELTAAIGPWEASYLLLKDGLSGDAAERLLADLQVEIRGAALSVSRLPESDARKEVSQTLLPILTAGFDSSGPFALGKKLRTGEALLDSKLAKNQTALANFSRGISKIRSDLSRDIETVVEGSYNTTRHVQWLLATLCILSLVVGLVFIRGFVLRGVGRPLTRLAEKTHQLAHGDYDIEPAKSRIREFSLIERALGVFADNAKELRLARDDLQSRNLSLRQSFEDLERFSYAASHDLRSPLRGIDTLANFIREDLGDDVPAEVAHHLDRMNERLGGMNTLLEDLLAYSRAGEDETEFVEVNLEALARSALKLLDVHSQVQLELDLQVESISAPEAPLYQVIRNLIDNSIKHHPNAGRVNEASTAPLGASAIVIVVRSRREHESTLIEFIDDGPGVSERYRNRVVELFETLESKNSSMRSGLGLAIVRKVLRRFGSDLELCGREDGLSGLNVKIRWPDGAKRHLESLESIA